MSDRNPCITILEAVRFKSKVLADVVSDKYVLYMVETFYLSSQGRKDKAALWDFSHQGNTPYSS